MLLGRTTAFIRIAVITAALLAAGCESMPVQEMSDARQAIMAAREAGAEEHAAEVLLEAEESLQSAEKYLNSRNYGVARREAIDAKTKAMDALRVSEASRESQN